MTLIEVRTVAEVSVLIFNAQRQQGVEMRSPRDASLTTHANPFDSFRRRGLTVQCELFDRRMSLL